VAKAYQINIMGAIYIYVIINDCDYTAKIRGRSCDQFGVCLADIRSVNGFGFSFDPS
jgi:hypothetical protein